MKKPKIRAQQLWNSKYVPPPSLEFFVSKKRIARTVRNVIVGEFHANKYRESLFIEMITLSRFAKCRKRKYRSDKGFRAIEKISKVIERMHTVDLKSAVSLVKANLTETFVPSKQLCRWILIKLQSSALLLQLLVTYCSRAASRLHQRLTTGHNWIEVTMALSMISRIWKLARLLLKISLVSYKKLVSIADDLTASAEETQWLRLKFPANLKKWISRKGILEP